jgi:penicillin-binding protein 2
MNIKPENQGREDSRLRLRIFSGIILLVVGLLTARLAQMQLLDREVYTDEAMQNSVQPRVVNPARGFMFDRNGLLVVDNQTSYSINLTPRYFDTNNIPLLANLMGVPDSLIWARYTEARQWSSFRTSRIFREVPFHIFARVKEQEWRLPGVSFDESQQRRYHGPARMAHVLGYIREISQTQLDRVGAQGYRMGDMIGQAGVEREYESVLRGRVGRSFVLVNVHGMEVQSYQDGIEDIPPQSGYELHLTIDARAQALAESLFVGKRGGMVAIDVRDGGIIAMTSAPDYDPRGLTGVLDPAFWQRLHGPDKPLFNRATQSVQPPGSTWKPFMSVVALEKGLITENTRLMCSGGYSLGGRFFRCLGVHGAINVHDAIRVSCNTFYYRLMMMMELNEWANWARHFGFGGLAPMDFPDQSSGLIPDSSYFNRVFPRGWGPGYTINLGIGQGNMGTTPLQLARYSMVVANGGILYAPHLVREQVEPDTGERFTPARPRPRRIPASENTWRIVQDAMASVVEAGTARRAQIPGFTSSGKTGTAQNPHGENHAVYVGYAPAENPQIAVGIIVENAGYGSVTAAPIASLVMEMFLRGEITDPQRIALKNSVMQLRSRGI